LLAFLNLKEDYPDGNFMIYYANGTVKKRSKYKMGIEIDSTFEYTNSNLLKTLTIWEDSIKYVKRTYWEDEKTIQRIRKCDGVNLQIQRRKDEKFVRPVYNLTYFYYDKSGLEISEEKFRKLYPQILPQLTRITRSKS
jgi:antitoxin component YwqK of YwqJK toxin-antitoxin module